MATCPRCKHHFREPEDEHNQHDCPRCGYGPDDDGALQCPTCSEKYKFDDSDADKPEKYCSYTCEEYDTKWR